MTKTIKRAIVVITTSFLAVSCSKSTPESSVDVLQYIPADTPYVFVSTEPVPSDLADKLDPTIDEILQAYQRVLRHIMAEQLVEMSSEENGAEDAERFRGIMEEILGLMSLQGIRDIGIQRESAFAFYGNGLLPVLRLELSDSALFDAAIKRIEEKAGEALLIGEANGQSYKYAHAEEANIIIATLDSQAVITVVPESYDESQIALALGIESPDRSLKQSETLQAINDEYGFSEYLTGFIDVRRLVGIFAGDATEQDQALFAAAGDSPPELSAVCQAEFKSMAGIAPRIVFGYSELNTARISSAMVIELRDDIAASLATVPAAVPSLGKDPGGLMSLGFGMNIMALREFYEARLDAMEADPYECELLADLQQGTAQGRAMLQQPIPPVVYGFKGFVLNVADMQGMDMAANKPPTSIDASVLIAVENAESLLGMAAMMVPDIAALNLLPDGKPVKLEMAQLAGFADDAFAALSENALSMSLGAGAEANAADLLTADSANPAPFMSMHIDSARYYAMVGEAMDKSAAGQNSDELPAAIQSAMRDVMVLSGSMYERMSVDVQFTERGIELNGRMTLSD